MKTNYVIWVSLGPSEFFAITLDDLTLTQSLKKIWKHWMTGPFNWNLTSKGKAKKSKGKFICEQLFKTVLLGLR